MTCYEREHLRHLPSFEELRPRVERAHAAVRRVIPRSGCELASALLVGELREAGLPATFVRGHYLAPDSDRNPLHAWVELDGLLLDPTRNQFSGDPFVETYPGTYVRDGGNTPADLEQYIYDLLGHQLPCKRGQVLSLVADYHLDPVRLEE
jgi:Transglutaminase-like superfamily